MTLFGVPWASSARTSRSRSVSCSALRAGGARARDQLLGRLRRQRRLAAGGGADARAQLVGLGVLEQVADRAGVERGQDAVAVGERRQHDHVRRRARGA